MNVVINSKCNKGCSFCFAKDTRDGDDMTFDYFKELLKFHQYGPIKLLGGEPTLHPDFLKMVNYAVNHGVNVTVISNFLFSETVKDGLVEILKNNKLQFLANGSKHSNPEMYDLFVENYNAIYKALYRRDEELGLGCGLTITNETPKELGAYIEKLSKDIISIERLRISMSFPGAEKDKDKFDFINNYTVGDSFVAAVSVCLALRILPNIDCTIFPCLFEHKEKFKYVSKFALHDREPGACGDQGHSCPGDVFADGSASHCYPLKDSVKFDNITKRFSSYMEVVGAMALKSRFLKGAVEAPEACQKCRYFIKRCQGPTMCYYSLGGK